MKGRRPPFWNRDAQTQFAAQRTAARKKRLAAALIPPEPPPPSADAPQPAAEAMPVGRTVGMMEAVTEGYRAARRMALYEQPSQRSPLLWAGGGSPPIVPPSDGDTAGAASPDPSANFAGGGAFHADATVVRPSEPDGDAENQAVQTAILPLFKLDAEAQELLSPPPHKPKKDTRGPARPRTKQTARVRTRQGAITNRARVIQHTKILIIALQEALDYDPVRGHNRRPPALWCDDPLYLNDVDALVVELRRLNSLLEAQRPRKKEAERAVIDLARHFDKFLHAYASWFGKGTALLTVVVIANLLQHAGLDPTAVCSAMKLPHV